MRSVVSEVETTWSFHNLYGEGATTLAVLLGWLTYWHTSRRAMVQEMGETIRRLEEEIKVLKDDNLRLGRDNLRYLEKIAELIKNGRH